MSPRGHRSRISHERWLVSYADFITLLFAFFVVLYAFSKADQKRQHQVSAAIDSGFQSLSIAPPAVKNTPAAPEGFVRSLSRTGTDRPASPAEIRTELESMRRDLQERLSAQIGRKIVAVQLSRDGLVISLSEAGYFDSGSAIPQPETAVTLQQISQAIWGTPYDLRVEGHTDNVPIHSSQFDSNWELSSARATSIARMLLEFHAIPAEQLSAAGYAEFHPVASNSSPEGRAENRRVDLVVMPHAYLDLPKTTRAENSIGWRKLVDE
jgi:chemotaxis protein MotB